MKSPLLLRMARRTLRLAGYDLRRLAPPRASALDPEIASAIARVRPATMVPEAGLVSLWRQVQYCEERELPGAFVECGVWNGGACGLMALANLRFGKQRRHLHLFDAFTDICQPDPTLDGDRAVQEAQAWAGLDRSALSGALEPMKGFYAHKGGPGSVERVRQLLERELGYPSEYIHCHVGWFQDTLPQVAPSIGPVALLRLDGDYYASTKVCLDHLGNQVTDGGFLVIDDYGIYDGCRRAVDEFLATQPPAFLHQATQSIHYLVVGDNSRRGAP